MLISSLTRTVTEPFAYANGNLAGQSTANQAWELVYNGFTSFEVSNGTARSVLGTAVTGAALRSPNLPDKWANGFQLTFDAKTDSLTIGHNHLDIIFGASAAAGMKGVAIYMNTADLQTADFDVLDNIHTEDVPHNNQYTNLIPFTQNVFHNVVITFTPNSPTTAVGVLTIDIDGVRRVTNTMDFTGCVDGIFILDVVALTASRWTIDNLVITSTYPVGRATSGGVAMFHQSVGGLNRVLGYRTYDAPSTFKPTNHTGLFDLGILVENVTLANPDNDGSGFAEGQLFELLFKTSADGTKTITFGNQYLFGLGSTSATTLAGALAQFSKNARVLFKYDSALAAFACTNIAYGH